MEEALCMGDVVAGGSGSGARDGFGAYGRGVTIIAVKVIPVSNIRIHLHAVLALAPGRLTRDPVCERAAVLFH